MKRKMTLSFMIYILSLHWVMSPLAFANDTSGTLQAGKENYTPASDSYLPAFQQLANKAADVVKQFLLPQRPMSNPFQQMPPAKFYGSSCKVPPAQSSAPADVCRREEKLNAKGQRALAANYVNTAKLFLQSLDTNLTLGERSPYGLACLDDRHKNFTNYIQTQIEKMNGMMDHLAKREQEMTTKMNALQQEMREEQALLLGESIKGSTKTDAERGAALNALIGETSCQKIFSQAVIQGNGVKLGLKGLRAGMAPLNDSSVNFRPDESRNTMRSELNKIFDRLDKNGLSDTNYPTQFPGLKARMTVEVADTLSRIAELKKRLPPDVANMIPQNPDRIALARLKRDLPTMGKTIKNLSMTNCVFSAVDGGDLAGQIKTTFGAYYSARDKTDNYAELQDYYAKSLAIINGLQNHQYTIDEGMNLLTALEETKRKNGTDVTVNWNARQKKTIAGIILDSRNVCEQRYQKAGSSSNSTQVGSDSQLAKDQAALDAIAEITKELNNVFSSRTSLSKIMDQVENCSGDGMISEVAQCTPDNLNTRSENFCFKIASTCQKQAQSCQNQLAQVEKVIATRVQQKAQSYNTAYNLASREMQAYIQSTIGYANFLNKSMTEQLGSILAPLPEGISVLPGGMTANNEFRIPLVNNGDHQEMFKKVQENLKNIKKNLADNLKNADSSFKEYRQIVEGNTKENKDRWEEVKHKCLELIDLIDGKEEDAKIAQQQAAAKAAAERAAGLAKGSSSRQTFCRANFENPNTICKDNFLQMVSSVSEAAGLLGEKGYDMVTTSEEIIASCSDTQQVAQTERTPAAEDKTLVTLCKESGYDDKKAEAKILTMVETSLRGLGDIKKEHLAKYIEDGDISALEDKIDTNKFLTTAGMNLASTPQIIALDTWKTNRKACSELGSNEKALEEATEKFAKVAKTEEEIAKKAEEETAKKAAEAALVLSKQKLEEATIPFASFTDYGLAYTAQGRLIELYESLCDKVSDSERDDEKSSLSDFMSREGAKIGITE
jgi:hypothetical protein